MLLFVLKKKEGKAGDQAEQSIGRTLVQRPWYMYGTTSAKEHHRLALPVMSPDGLRLSSSSNLLPLGRLLLFLCIPILSSHSLVYSVRSPPRK